VSVSLYSAQETLSHAAVVKQYGPMVRRVASQLALRLPSNVAVDDLVQAGMIGLFDALSRYEDGHGAQFETFAMQRIRGAMIDELRSSDWVSRSTRKNQRAIEAAIQKLEQKLFRAPIESEVAEHMALPLADYQQLLAEAKGAQLVYVDEFSDEDGHSDFLERQSAGNASDPAKILYDSQFRQALIAGIERLPEREKQVMGMYYEQEMNLKEIGVVLGVSESRICQLHSQAVSRIRAGLKTWLKD
jgi:RNA polymerase sigma factor FliA